MRISYWKTDFKNRAKVHHETFCAETLEASWILHLAHSKAPLQQPLLRHGDCGRQRGAQGDLPREEWAGELQIFGGDIQIWPGFSQRHPQHLLPLQLWTSVMHGGVSHLANFLQTRRQRQQQRDGTMHAVLAFALDAHGSFGSDTNLPQQQP